MIPEHEVPNWRALVVAIVALLGAACTDRYYIMRTGPESKAGKALKLRVGVRRFSLVKLDNMFMAFSAYPNFIPTYLSVGENQEDIEDQLTRVFCEKLRHSGLFESVEMPPPSQAEADVILRGEITKFVIDPHAWYEVTIIATSYFNTGWIFPLHRCNVEYAVRLVAETPDGQSLGEWRRELAVGKLEWAVARACRFQTMPVPINEAVNEVYASLIKDIELDSSKLERRLARPPGGVERPPEVATPGATAGTTPVPPPPLPPPLPGAKWAIVVGISQYQHRGKGGLTNLAFADEDAKAFRDALVAQGWSPNHINVLLNPAATRSKVETALRYGPELQDSLLVVYWAGHGYSDPLDASKLFLACHDTDLSEPGTGLRMTDLRSWLEERKARNVVIIADACQAGGLLAGEGADATTGRDIKWTVQMKPDRVPPGWVYLLGSRKGEKAAESARLQGGLYTRSLVEALGGSADGYGMIGKKDGTVTLGEIREYVRDKVKERAFQLHLSGLFETVDYTDTGDTGIWNLSLKAK